MDKFFRFSDYDLFGYLASGMMAFALWDVAFDSHLVLRDDWSISRAVAVILAGYIIGHIVTGLATWSLDRALVRTVFGTAANVLLMPSSSSKGLSVRRVVFGEFFEPLNASLRRRLLQRARMRIREAEIFGAGETIFWRAWPTIKRDAIPYARAESFLKLYGFCRNVSFLTIAAFLIFVAKAFCASDGNKQAYLLWACASALVSFVMFRRYLRFFRLYSVEVFSTFADKDS